MYNAILVAQYIVTKCLNDGKPISNLHLQKILYYVQEAFLIKKGKPCFFDEIQAWKFGPVVPRVYYYYCHRVAMDILDNEYQGGIAEEDAVIIDEIVNTKRAKKPWELVADTHVEGSAWFKTYKNGRGQGETISPDLIKECANNANGTRTPV